jgi:zinc transport system permease protein
MTEFFQALFTNHLLLYALLAGLVASIVGGIIGSYVVVKRIAFIGGSISPLCRELFLQASPLPS